MARMSVQGMSIYACSLIVVQWDFAGDRQILLVHYQIKKCYMHLLCASTGDLGNTLYEVNANKIDRVIHALDKIVALQVHPALHKSHNLPAKGTFSLSLAVINKNLKPVLSKIEECVR